MMDANAKVTSITMHESQKHCKSVINDRLLLDEDKLQCAESLHISDGQSVGRVGSRQS